MASSTSILVHDNKILFILRDNKSEISEPNTWQLPGGGVENSENHLQAIQRELKEEINIVPKKLKYLGSASDDIKVFFSYLSDDEVSNIKLGNEGQQLHFFALNEVVNIPLTKKLQFYFFKFKSGITKLIDTGDVENVKDLGLT